MALVNRLSRLLGGHAAEQEASHKPPAGEVLPDEPDCDVCGGSWQASPTMHSTSLIKEKISKRILLWAYLEGYQQHLWPRWLRRLIVGTELHRAWLSGHMGVFEPDGGVCSREWYTRR